MALATAPFAAPATGQVPVSTEMPSGAGAVLPDADNAVLVIEDPAEDTQAVFAPTSAPGTPLDQMADITSITLAETEEALRIDLAHRGYDGALFTTSRAAQGMYYCQVGFSINGVDDIRYTTYLNAYLGDDGQPTYNAYTQRIDQRGDRYDYDWLGNVPVGFVEDHFEFSIDKHWLSVAPRDRALQPGDRVTDLSAFCIHSAAVLIGGAFYDWTDPEDPGTGTGSYTITTAPGSSLVALTFLGGDGPIDSQSTLAVATSGPTKQTLELVNQADLKLLVNMTARITDGAGTVLDGWQVVVPPTLELKTDEPARATLVITPPPGAQHRAGGVLELVADPLGHDDPARITRPVAASVPLTPENNTLWFHNGWRGGCFFVECTLPDGTPPIVEQQTEWFVLAPVEEHPIYDREHVESGKVRFRGWGDAGTVLDLDLVKDIRFDPEGTIDITLGLSGDVEREIDVSIDLVVDWGEEYIGGTEEIVTLTAEASEHTFSVRPREEALELSKGTQFQMLFSARERAGSISYTNPGGPIDFYPAMSRMDLPLLPVSEGSFDLTDGRALPTIQPRNGTELDEYVNPGKKQVYDLSLVNEGSEEDVLKVDVETDRDDWGVQLLPGNRFKLEPGRAAPFSVVVTAPEDAAEGDTATVTLTATSANDPDVQSTITLRTIVATDVPIEDEEYTEPTGEDKVEPYVDDTEEASSTAMLLVFPLALGLLGPFLRRRR